MNMRDKVAQILASDAGYTSDVFYRQADATLATLDPDAKDARIAKLERMKSELVADKINLRSELASVKGLNAELVGVLSLCAPDKLYMSDAKFRGTVNAQWAKWASPILAKAKATQ